jgi:hypothetical protein
MTEEEKTKYDKHLEKLIKSLRFSWIPIAAGILLVKVVGWEFDDLGPFGDFLAGSTVPLFTLVSSIGVILTLRMQQKQLEMQREELQNSIVEMQETRKVMIEQGETMTLQRFESTFFNMLNLHSTIIKSLSISDDIGTRFTERETFKVLVRQIAARYNNDGYQSQKKELYKVADELDFAYRAVYNNNEPMFGQYFKNLGIMVKFVDASNISNENKQMYMEMIKSQFSSKESTVLIYHGISKQGRDILNIIRKYNLIEGYDSRLLVNDGDMDTYIFENDHFLS